MGVRLIFIGNGTPLMASDFKTMMKLEAPVWVDQRRASYKALGFRRSTPLHRMWKTLLSSLRAAKKGYRQVKTQGDAYQLGGIVVARRGGNVEYSAMSSEAGDHPPMNVVLEAAQRASGE